jgi:hypothetical protein
VFWVKFVITVLKGLYLKNCAPRSLIVYGRDMVEDILHLEHKPGLVRDSWRTESTHGTGGLCTDWKIVSSENSRSTGPVCFRRTFPVFSAFPWNPIIRL